MKRKIILAVVIAIIIGIVTILTCHFFVVCNAKGKLYENVDNIPAAKFGLLLGTTPQSRYGGNNLFFKYRIDATEKLYKAGKIEYILISGDENSLDGVNEPECMKDSLVVRGIPRSVIFLDGKGLSTYESIVRTHDVYDVNSYTVISQQFHNERALYLAEHLGLDIEQVQAFNAESPNTTFSIVTYLREYLARVKMVIDIFTDNHHKESYQKIDLNKNNQE